VDADERDAAGIRGLLDDLVGDPHERASHVVTVEDDPGAVHLGCGSFLASRDRVKGAVLRCPGT
jgi:hypothetical protein